MTDLPKALVAEFIGAFALVFFGAGAGTVLGFAGGATNLVSVALAHGLAIMMFAYAFGHLSGLHINPAVTFGVAVAGKFETSRILPYIVAQLLGAIAAGFVLLYVFGGPINHLGVTLVNHELTTISGAFVLEMIGTFFLASVVLNMGMARGAHNLMPFGYGLTVTACIVFFGPLTGASVNPARTIGPAVATGVYTDIWVYLVATSLGGILAGLLFRFYLRDKLKSDEAVPVAGADEAVTRSRTTAQQSRSRRTRRRK